MNDQEAFDKMVTHLFTQKEKALSPLKACKYRTDSGLKCAVGALIPDDEYSKQFEGKRVPHIIDSVPSLKGLSLTMLSRVQAIHDNRPVDMWFEKLQEICRLSNLDSTVLNTFKEAIPSE